MIDRAHTLDTLTWYFRGKTSPQRALRELKLTNVIEGPAGDYFCLNFDGELHITKNKVEASECRWSEIPNVFAESLSDEIRDSIVYDISRIPGIFLDDIDIHGSTGGAKGLLDNRNPIVRVVRETHGGGLINCFLPLEEQEKVIKWLRKQTEM